MADHIEELRRLLKSRRGAPGEVSAATGIPVATLYNFAAGEREMTPDRVEQVARALGVRLMLVPDPIVPLVEKAKG